MQCVGYYNKVEIKMQSENVYIGDEKFQRFLDHYNCPTPLYTAKLKFAGAICSPNADLRPTDVIASLFPENMQPRLATKTEAELFFKFFMGLWDEMFAQIRTNTLELPRFDGDSHDRNALEDWCRNRADQVEFGFVEGFWGGCEQLSIPNFAAELVSSLSDMAEAYAALAKKLQQAENTDDIFKVILNTDKMVEKTFKFLIEHLVLPHIQQMQRQVN